MFEVFSKKRRAIAALILMFSVESSVEASIEIIAGTVSQIDAIEQTYHLYSRHVVDEVVIEKRYSSRSEFRGFFGFGWCSDLDGKVEKYADQSIRYSGCDSINSKLLDPRTSAKEIIQLGSGFRRVREDGAVQTFDRTGRLVSLQKVGRLPLRLIYSKEGLPKQITSGRSRIEIRYNQNFDLIESLRGNKETLHFSYLLDLLVQNVTEIYSYKNGRSLTQRISSDLQETVEYRTGSRFLSRVEKRFRASPDERLLMSLVANEESDEIQIDAERGAEMRPVRILYRFQLRTLDLFGDRETARRILEWMKS